MVIKMIKLTREDIRDTALILFKEKGYNNVTIDDICDECHITKPTFYKYVGSKEGLILDLYDITIEELIGDTYLFINTDTHIEQLLVIFKRLLQFTKELGYDLFSQMIISNLNENYHSFDMRDALTDIAVTIIEKAQKRGEIRNLNSPKSLYQTLGYAFMGYETVWCIYNGETDIDKQVHDTIMNVLDVREDLRKKYSEL
jgi:AcrR family transcriptional regulator